MTIPWSQFCEIVNTNQRFLLTSHVRPDCDALGSELAMAGVLEALGKEVFIVNGHPTPPNLSFIDPQRRIQTLAADGSLSDIPAHDVLMILDTSAWAQLGTMGAVVRETPARKIILDHHVSEDDLGAESFKDPRAEATGVLVIEAAKRLGVPLNAAIATPAFAAVATDTGWFRFPSVDGDTYRVGALLIESGAVPSEIYQQLYEQDTVGRVRLRGRILSRVACELDGVLAHTYVLQQDFQEAGALPSDTEDVINMLLEIAGVQFAVILVELPSQSFKLSFRSRCQLDCSEIAEKFGGGGHKAAAGATVEGTFADVQPRVLDVVRAAMR